MKGEVMKTNTALVDPSEFEGMSGSGLEDARPEEMKRSLLNLLQQASKAATRGSPEYIQGAQAGMFLSSGSRRLFETIEFVVVARGMKFLEWTPLEDENGNPQEGGFKGEHDPDSEFVRNLRTPENRFKPIWVPDRKTELIQTMELWALIGEPGFNLGSAELVNIPFTSIKIKHYTDWYDTARRLRYETPNGWVVPDIWRHRWKLTAEFEQKWKPNGAWNVRIALAGDIKEQSLLLRADPLCQEAKKLANMIKSGEIKADYEGGSDTPTGNGGKPNDIDDPPF